MISVQDVSGGSLQYPSLSPNQTTSKRAAFGVIPLSRTFFAWKIVRLRPIFACKSLDLEQWLEVVILPWSRFFNYPPRQTEFSQLQPDRVLLLPSSRALVSCPIKEIGQTLKRLAYACLSSVSVLCERAGGVYECGVKYTQQGLSVRGNMKIALLPILTLTVLQTASVAAANPNQLSRVRFCMPHATRFTKCIENKVAECTRSRGINCKTRRTCVVTSQICDLRIPDLQNR